MEETNVMESVGPIVATVESAPVDVLAALDRRVRDLESAIGDLRTVRAQAEAAAGRKTVPAAQVSVLAKGSVDDAAGAPLDDAMRSLSMEQRFAVKSGLIRAGLLR